MNHSHAAKKLFHSTLAFSEVLFKNERGVELPGITGDSQKAVSKLLDLNDAKFDIYFNNAGFHNHCAHHLLAAYSLGASPQLLESIYEKNTSYLRPRLPSKVKITKQNWTDNLGKMDLWTDYLEFFKQETDTHGMQKTFEEYCLHKDMFPRLFESVFHPIIHVGYGVEFQIPLIFAEGLAETAVTKLHLADLLNDEYFNKKGDKKIIDIINDVVKDDNEFGGFLSNYGYQFQATLEKKVDPIRNYASHWKIEETEEGVKEATRELFESIILVYGASAFRPDKKTISLDFFLMHGVTSMLFVDIILPYVNLETKIKMLKSQFASFLVHFIARGRPKLHIDILQNYKPQTLKNDPNPWDDMIKRALHEDAESHVIKVVRSMLKAEQEWGPREDNLYIKIAQLTVEGHEKYGWSW